MNDANNHRTAEPVPPANGGEASHGRARPVTIVDVARQAGVSHSTVSRVLNGHPHIKDETRRRVLAAVDGLGYVANLPARRLAGGRTGIVGLVVLHLDSSYIMEIVRAVDASLAEVGLELMLCTTHQREQRESSYVAQLSFGLVDGLIVLIPSDHDRYTDDLAGRRFPFVLLDHGGSPLANTVNTDSEGGTVAAIDHLVGLGHRRIGFITGNLVVDAAQDRLAAFRASVARHGLDPDPALVVEGDFLEASGYRATQRLLALPERPTAIFTSADTAAFGALRALWEAGVDVPGQVSVIGYDDIPAAATATPPLTTVRQPLAEMGRRAVELLIERLEEPERTVSHVRLPVELVVRASTGPASSPPAG